ncbi:hypothetical protein JX265_012445 [Neoarthrinium moseri]|uniref:Uncharacterized protein n=1 Tax=Neoarthrinium moseri TaxID=1658444 RepID=A0A9Q0AIM6_9PEZI|nr:hypothetical protein JX265_012445 [Neoarthrinium moseri]
MPNSSRTGDSGELLRWEALEVIRCRCRCRCRCCCGRDARRRRVAPDNLAAAREYSVVNVGREDPWVRARDLALEARVDGDAWEPRVADAVYVGGGVTEVGIHLFLARPIEAFEETAAAYVGRRWPRPPRRLSAPRRGAAPWRRMARDERARGEEDPDDPREVRTSYELGDLPEDRGTGPEPSPERVLNGADAVRRVERLVRRDGVYPLDRERPREGVPCVVRDADTPGGIDVSLLPGNGPLMLEVEVSALVL